MSRFLGFLVLSLSVSGCAGMVRGCSSSWASAAGADWIIVQYTAMGEPFRCWTLDGVSVTNEEGSDGIYWQSEDGHLVHISGHYNRVQISGGDWDSAFEELGLTRELCEEIREARWSPPWPPALPSEPTRSPPVEPDSSDEPVILNETIHPRPPIR